MKTVAWDTSTAVSAIALVDGERVVAQEREPRSARHGDVLLPRVAAMLCEAGWDRSEVALIGVGLGPGSFTGLRVGLATAQGWALATGVPVVGIVSHRAIGLSALDVSPRAVPALEDPASLVAVVTDAFKGEVYVSVYGRPDRSGADALVERLAPFNAEPARAAERIAEVAGDGQVRLAGDGLRRYPEVWPAVLGARAKILPEHADVPCPVTLARLCQQRLATAGPSPLRELAPLYVRGSDARLPTTPLDVEG